MSLRRLLGFVAAVLGTLSIGVPWPLPVQGLLLSLAALGALSSPWWPCGCLGMGDWPPIEREGP